MKNLLKVSLIACMALLVTGAIAQRPDRERTSEKRTNEQMAKMRTERLAKDFALSAEQQEKIYSLYLEMMNERPELPEVDRKSRTKPTDAEMEARRIEMQKRMDRYDAEMKQILTPEQYQQWSEREREMMMKNGGRLGDGERRRPDRERK